MASLCDDSDLGYLRSRTAFPAAAGLTLDDKYRLAHLPLAAPGHPRIIAARDGTPYSNGRHARVLSQVLPIPAELLEASAAWRALEAELRAAPFAAKIAWHLLPRRRDKLHVTLYGRALPLTPAERRALAAIGPIDVELRGMFSGNINIGRLYLRLYPEKRRGENALGAIQRALGRRATDLHVVGVWNLVDDLDSREAAALAALIERWWDRPVLRFRADRLWLLASSDDLVLDSDVVEVTSLAAPA